jgi:hypothetical protein
MIRIIVASIIWWILCTLAGISVYTPMGFLVIFIGGIIIGVCLD